MTLGDWDGPLHSSTATLAVSGLIDADTVTPLALFKLSHYNQVRQVASILASQQGASDVTISWLA
jgi:hypothetical protein